MLKRIILAMSCFPLGLHAQTEPCTLTLQEASALMSARNPSQKIAEKAVSMMQGEKQKLNAFWYPMLNTSGMYVHLSDKVEVKQPLNTYTEPAKE
ncbi:MAG: TolC family protein, partial [Bacteroidaceae bacterium]|nr:TolC family protein [Bacteroidaceae bacterium]